MDNVAKPILDALASMRPGQSCPGVGARNRAIARDRGCFNEAGAIMPRSGEAAIPLTAQLSALLQ